jgi:hypothetical protein
MARNGFKILDSDMHLMEPVDLWQRYKRGTKPMPREDWDNCAEFYKVK